MRVNEITLIFPPVHDFAMPYLSLPLLKRYVEENTPVKCNIVDFNQKFFNKVIGLNKKRDKLYGYIKTNNRNNSVYEAIELQGYAELKIDNFLKNYPGYTISLRKIKTLFDTTKSEGIYRGLQSKYNLFADVFSEFLDDHKFNNTCIWGISLDVEDQIFPSFALVKVIKDLFPKTKIVLGGNIITRLYDNILKSKLATYVDYLIIKEGEDALKELVEYHITKKIRKLSHPKILNTKNDKIPVINKDIKKFITDVKRINTPDFDGFDLNSYLSPIPILPIFITRKCYWGKCDFCSIHTSWDSKYRMRKIEKVLDDIEFYINQGIRHFRIIDEDCLPNILDRFSINVLNKGLNIFFEAYSRFENKFLDRHFCRKIARAGCRQLFFGLESVDEETLIMINKIKKGAYHGNYKDIIDKILKNTNDAGIVNYVFVMTGIPSTPIEGEVKTISYLVNNKNIHVVTLGSFVVDKDSPIHIYESIRRKYNVQMHNIGDMTTEIGYVVNGEDVRNSIQKRTIQYASEVYKNRPDLALTSIINDDIRFILACKFGNKFAQEFISSCKNEQIENIVNDAIKKCYEERIKRELVSFRGCSS